MNTETEHRQPRPNLGHPQAKSLPSAPMPRLVALLAALLLLAAACGSDSDGEDATAPSATSAAEATEQPTGEAAAPSTTSTSEQPAETTTTTEPSAPPLLFEPGPYDVGVITLQLDDRLTEVWYPAAPASGSETEIFDSLSVFPEELQSFIPDELSGLIDTGAYRDAPPVEDVPEGGFPLVVYSHGFGGYRQVATFYTTHLASWGHVVASTDHLERGIAAQASGTVGEDRDVEDVLASIELVIGDEFTGPLTDATSVLVTGHSAGAGAAAEATQDPLVDAYVSISGGPTEEVAQKPALVVIGELDNVAAPERSTDLFEQLEADAVVVNVELGGHNSFTDSCRRIRDLGGLGMLTDLIGEEQVDRGENGCTPDFVQPEPVQATLNHYTVALLATLFGNSLVDGDPQLALTTDVSADLSVQNLDEGASGSVNPEFVDFRTK